MNPLAETFANQASHLLAGEGRALDKAVVKDAVAELAPKLESHLSVSPASQAAARRLALKDVISPVTQADLAHRPLKIDPSAGPLLGSKPKVILRDAGGQTYMFKPNDGMELQAKAEIFANTARSLAGEPTLPIAQRTVTLNGQEITGQIKPMIPKADFKGRPEQWSSAFRETVLSDHAFAEGLGNLDTKLDQYLVVPTTTGSQLYNADWDYALGDLKAPQVLSRYKGLMGVPNAQNLLYDSYVHGRIDLDFAPLTDAIRRYQAVPDAQLATALQPYLKEAFAAGKPVGPFATPQAMLQAVLDRKATLGDRFDTFIAELKAERADNLGQSAKPPSIATRLERGMQQLRFNAAKAFFENPHALPALNWLAQRMGPLRRLVMQGTS